MKLEFHNLIGAMLLAVWCLIEPAIGANTSIGTIVSSPSPVHLLAWSPDSQYLAVGALSQRGVTVYHANNWSEAFSITGHTGTVNSVAWSPDSQYLATGSDDHTARVWSSATGAPIGMPMQHDSEVQSVAWSPDTRFLASGSGRCGLASCRPCGEVTPVATDQCPDFANRSIRVSISSSCHWSTPSEAEATVGSLCKGQGECGTSQTLHNCRFDYRQFGRSYRGVNNIYRRTQPPSPSIGNVSVWTIADGHISLHQQLNGHTDRVNSVAWRPDSQQLASGSSDSSVLVWNVIAAAAATDVSGSGSDNAGDDGTAVEWSVVHNLTAHSSGVELVAWSPDSRLASGGSVGRVKVWNTTTGRARTQTTGARRYSSSPARVRALEWSLGPRHRLAGALSGNVLIWRDSGSIDGSIAAPPWSTPLSVAWSPRHAHQTDAAQQLAVGLNSGVVLHQICDNMSTTGPACEYTDSITCAGKGKVQYDGSCRCQSPVTGVGPSCSEYSNQATCSGNGVAHHDGSCTCSSGEDAYSYACGEDCSDTCLGPVSWLFIFLASFFLVSMLWHVYEGVVHPDRVRLRSWYVAGRRGHSDITDPDTWSCGSGGSGGSGGGD